MRQARRVKAKAPGRWSFLEPARARRRRAMAVMRPAEESWAVWPEALGVLTEAMAAKGLSFAP